MPLDSRIGRFVVLVATALASALLLVINPFTGVAQTVSLPDQPSRPDKQAILAREAQHIAAARIAPRPAKDALKPLRIQAHPLQLKPQLEASTALPSAPRTPAGAGTVVESGLAPFAGSLYTFENRWFKPSGDADLVVYAGAERADPLQGLVAVRLIRRTLGPAALYRTPTRAGAVRVAAADGERLTLVSRSGTRFVFDVSSRSFVR